jgi:excisionase family DNA binding protein
MNPLSIEYKILKTYKKTVKSCLEEYYIERNYTPSQIAEILSCSRFTVNRLIRESSIPPKKTGKPTCIMYTEKNKQFKSDKINQINVLSKSWVA